MSSSTSLSALIRKIDDITVSTVDSTVALARSIHEAIAGIQKASAEVVLDPRCDPPFNSILSVRSMTTITALEPDLPAI